MKVGRQVFLVAQDVHGLLEDAVDNARVPMGCGARETASES